MRKLRCKREGRVGFSVGDEIEIPDNVDAFDTTYFEEVKGEQQNDEDKQVEDETPAPTPVNDNPEQNDENKDGDE